MPRTPDAPQTAGQVSIRPDQIFLSASQAEIYNSVFSTSLKKATPPKPLKKFWRFFKPGQPESEYRYEEQGKDFEMFIGNPFNGPLLIRGHENKQHGIVYNICRGNPSEVLASYNANRGVVVIGREYEHGLDHNGSPSTQTRDVTRLLKELKDYIETCPDASKKQRYIQTLKPSVEAMLDLVSQ